MSAVHESLSLARPHPDLSGFEKIGWAVLACGVAALIVAAFGWGSSNPKAALLTVFGLTGAGGLWVAVARNGSRTPASQNTGMMKHPATSRGIIGWVLGVVLTAFYIVLYWFPAPLENLVRMVDPLSRFLRGTDADRWFLYGTLYTFGVSVMGIRAIIKYRHSRYQIVRTASIIFFQSVFAFTLPALLRLFNQPEYYFSYFWPLKYQYLFPTEVDHLWNYPGGIGVAFVVYGLFASFILVPVLTYFFGKRWYCSWVCGCGGLANTVGDPWRQLSDKRLKAWKFERWSIHSVLVFIVVTTALLWIDSWSRGAFLGRASYYFARTYGFLVGAVWSGVVGVGFYPLMGTRVWCRFGCPQAAILGILQKYFSRFRITVNGDQCISCGNCSTYCEMGIDVKWYAQRGQNVVRASCVGCGICSTVCPRGVLNLETGPVGTRR